MVNNGIVQNSLWSESVGANIDVDLGTGMGMTIQPLENWLV